MWGCAQTELDGQWLRYQNKSMKVREALMWKITTHDLTLQELLIMAAMNVASALIATDKGERTIWRSRAHRGSRWSRKLSWQK
jgi:hypothetical protein